MRLASVAMLATLIAGATTAVQAADFQLNDVQLDGVSAGLSLSGFSGIPRIHSTPGFPGTPGVPGVPSGPGLPESSLLQQLPAILTAGGYGDVLTVFSMFRQGGSMGGIHTGGLPIVGN